MRVGFICAFGPGMGHISRCMALRKGLEECGHEIVDAFDECDWVVVDGEAACRYDIFSTNKGCKLLHILDDNHSYWPTDLIIRPHDAPHMAWVGQPAPFKMVQMGMSPRGIAIEDELMAFDFGTEFGESTWVIGAPGHSSWERCADGVPTMQVVFCEGHKQVAQACEKAGAAITVWDETTEGKLVPERLRSRVIAAMDANDEQAVSKAATALCDGRGVQRTIELMESMA